MNFRHVVPQCRRRIAGSAAEKLVGGCAASATNREFSCSGLAQQTQFWKSSSHQYGPSRSQWRAFAEAAAPTTPTDYYGDELRALILPGEKPTPEQLEASAIDCAKVEVRASELLKGQGNGAFAKVDVKRGELVERGLVYRLPLDGNANTHVFTWSDDRTEWAAAAGCAVFYNSTKDPNTEMVRLFDEDRFEIYAVKDIKAGEELTHKYRSLQWRKAFDELKQFH